MGRITENREPRLNQRPWDLGARPVHQQNNLGGFENLPGLWFCTRCVFLVWHPDLHARDRGFHFLNSRLMQPLRESPRMTLRVDDTVGAVTVELICGLLNYHTSGGTGALEVRVDTVCEPHADGLGVHAAD